MERISEKAEGIWRGGVRKRAKTPRPRVRRIFSGKEEQKILKDSGKTIYDLTFIHGMDSFQQQQQLADHREGHYEYKSGVFQQSAEEGGWGGMIVRVELAVSVGRNRPRYSLLKIIFPMPEEQTEVFGPEWWGQDRTPRMKPVVGRIVQRYFGPQWTAMGIRFLEDAPLASEEGKLITDTLENESESSILARERQVLGLRHKLLWWDVEPSRLDKKRLGKNYLLDSFNNAPPDNLPPDTAAIKDFSIVPANEDEGPRLSWDYWHSFEDMKKRFGVDKIDQQTVKESISGDAITIVADPEETESLLDILLELAGAPEE